MQFRTTALAAVVCTALFGVSGALAQERLNDPPNGFVAVFNGKDLSGWHGMPHFDPRKLAALSEEDRSKKLATDTEDAKKHWSVADGVLVNDGHGAYLTTDKEFGDWALDAWPRFNDAVLGDPSSK